MTFHIRRLNGEHLAVTDDGTRAWTVSINMDRTVRRIANATSGKPLKLDGPLGKRITAAVHDWLVECAEQLPAALDEYVAALMDAEGGNRGALRLSPREITWRRCEQLGATHGDYIRARRHAEGNAA